MPPASLPPPKCCICMEGIEEPPYVEQGRWFLVAHVECSRKKHGYGIAHNDGEA